MLEAAVATIAPLVPRIEAERRLPREAVDALVTAGVFKLLVPRAYGGADDPRAAIEEIARVDGSAGWCAMVVGSLATTTAGRVLLDIDSDVTTL